MKDFKTLMIGFLLATCMFLLMGQGSSKSDIGKYQAYTYKVTHYLLDTSTGETFYRYSDKAYWKQVVKPYQMVKDGQIKEDASDDVDGFKK